MSRTLRRLLLVLAAIAAVARGLQQLLIRRWRANDAEPPPPQHIDGARRTVETDDGAALSVVEVGSGPTVLLAHGIGGRADHWSRVAAALLPTHRIVAYDQRGHGASTRGSERITPDRLGRDLIAVLEATGSRGAVVVGHSMGGIGVQAALAHGLTGLVGGIVLLATVPRPAIGGTGSSQRSAAWFVRMARHPQHGLLLMRGGFGRRASLQDLDELRSGWAEMSIAAFAEALDGLASFDFRDTLAATAFPVEVVCGSADLVTPKRYSVEIAAVLPDAELTLLPEIGHMVLWEDVPAVVDAVGRAAARGRSAGTVTSTGS